MKPIHLLTALAFGLSNGAFAAGGHDHAHEHTALHGGVVAEAKTNVQMVVRGTVDLDKLHMNRETGVAPTFRDRRRRADVYRAWPSRLEARKAPGGKVRRLRG